MYLVWIFAKIGYNCFTSPRSREENAANWIKSNMKIIFIIWLILAILTSIFVVGALMLSSRISQEEGHSESYEEWEAANQTQELYQRQAEQ